MDMTVTGIGSVVVAELRAAGYQQSTIGQYGRTIRVLARFAAGRGSDYSPELGAEFASMTVSPRTGRFSAQRRMDYGRLTRVFDSCVRTGRVDLSVRRRGGGGPRPAYARLAELDAAWEAEMARRGLAAATREAYGRVARGYLVFLEQRGISDLADADGGSVLAFLESLLDRWAKSSLFWVVSNFRPFLKFTGRADLVAAVSLARVRRSRPVIEVLGDADLELVIRACAAGRVSARNAAITLLAVTTGLRACDVIALRLAGVDWRGSTIGIIQRKTGNPLTLPLPALVMGKLAGYVLGERPATADEHVFVRSLRTARAAGRSRFGAPGDISDVRHGGRGRCESRDPVPAAQRRDAAAARSGAAADDLFRAMRRILVHRPDSSVIDPSGLRRRILIPE